MRRRLSLILAMVLSACFMSPNPSEPRAPGELSNKRRQASREKRAAVPGGTYLVGCNVKGICEGNPERHVNVPSYTIDRYQVLETDYARCESLGICPQHVHIVFVEQPPDEVAMVRYDGALAYCKWAGGHLPSNVEWEIAGRGKPGYLYPWGNVWSKADMPKSGYQRYADLFNKYPMAGTRPDLKSPFGVEDMSGNAPEFVHGEAGAETRGCPHETRRTGERPGSDVYSLVMAQSADGVIAAFRCVYSE
jgi:formylglycine-generating enzyme required for sulfatase activity